MITITFFGTYWAKGFEPSERDQLVKAVPPYYRKFLRGKTKKGNYIAYIPKTPQHEQMCRVLHKNELAEIHSWKGEKYQEPKRYSRWGW
ncbi:MAG: hypothetical protein F6K24_03525 [Okeania sp. SIO2D1]|nr:hypothetical protein [Okeania sp. SIO2D1]